MLSKKSSEKPPYKIIITVKEIKGECPPHRVGDRYEIIGDKTKGQICLAALTAIYPTVYAMKFGAEFPWAKDKDVEIVCCPDPINLVTYEIRRVRSS